MPSAHNHNHNDRGTLHDDCQACALVATMMSEAGVHPAQVQDLRREPTVVTNVFNPDQDLRDWLASRSESPLSQRLAGQIDASHTAQQHLAAGLDYARRRYDDPWAAQANLYAEERPDLDIAGTEMGNKAEVTEREAEQTEREFLTRLLDRARSVALPYGAATMVGHAYLEHEHFMIPIDLSLGQIQEVHSSLHHMGIGHGDNADHFVREFQREALKARLRLLEQKHWSALSKGLKAEQHRRRERSARASREAVMVESARSLKRAIEHTKGTVLPRVSFDEGGITQVVIKTGVKDRVTIAAASIGNDTAIGTAICHPTDRFDAEVGYQLAIARAMIALGSVHELEWMTKVTERNG